MESNKILILVSGGNVAEVHANTHLEVTIIDVDNMMIGEDYVTEFEVSPMLQNELQEVIKEHTQIKA